MKRRGARATMPAPNQAPTTAATIMAMSVVRSTVTIATKTSASTTVGKASPTFRVPGMSSSAMRRCILKMAVVGAKHPIPRVSKKLVPKPIRTSAGRGFGLPPAARSRANQRHR